MAGGSGGGMPQAGGMRGVPTWASGANSPAMGGNPVMQQPQAGVQPMQYPGAEQGRPFAMPVLKADNPQAGMPVQGMSGITHPMGWLPDQPGFNNGQIAPQQIDPNYQPGVTRGPAINNFGRPSPINGVNAPLAGNGGGISLPTASMPVLKAPVSPGAGQPVLLGNSKMPVLKAQVPPGRGLLTPRIVR